MTKEELIKRLETTCFGLDPIDPLRLLVDDVIEALAQPEQEPVAWMFQHDETGRMNYVSNDGIHKPTMFLEMNPRYALVCALYTTPPQRTWVGLTDEQLADCMDMSIQKTCRAIEARLKELNT